MATADDYAAWIVKNASKRGTEEFDTVARAYEEAKAEESLPREPSPQAPQAAQARGTTVAGVAGAATRGLAPVAGGAALGAIAGAPFAGVGAVPGAIAGAAAGGLATAVGDPVVNAVNNLLGTQFTTPTQAIENLLTRVGVARPQTDTERVVQSAASGAGGAGGMVAAGQALAKAASPVVSGVGQMLAQAPKAQIMGGAGAGAGSQLAEESGMGPVGQIAGALAGGVVGARMGTPRVAVSRAAQQSDVAATQAAGIRPMTSDILTPETFAAKWLQTAGERVPVAGTGGMRQAQQAQRVEAVKSVLDDFGVTTADDASAAVMADLAKKRSAELTKYSQLKNEVIDRLDSAGPVPLAKTTQAIDDQITKLRSLNTEEVNPVIARLDDWKKAINGQSLSNVETLRKQIGEAFKAPELSAVRSTGEKSLSAIYSPLKQEMGEFIKANGQRRDIDRWGIANRRLSEMAGEIKTGTLKSVLAKGDVTPEAVNQLLFSTKASEVRTLFGKLSPQGRATARAAILARAAEKATSADQLSPTKFANEVERLGKSVGVFFGGEDKARVDGLIRALNVTRRAGEAAANPPTGAQVAIPVGAAVLADVMGSAGAALASGATIGGFARIYESAPMRNLLMQMRQTKPGSAEEAAIAKRIISALTVQGDQND